MGQFVTHRFSQADHHISIRIEENGSVQVLKTATYGEIISNVHGQISPLRARDLIAEMQMIAPGLQHVGGDLTVGMGFDAHQPQIWTVPSHSATMELHKFVDGMRRVALEVLSMQRARFEADATRERRVASGPSPIAFALWTLAFIVGHAIAGLLGYSALVFCKAALGLIGLFLGLAILLAFVATAYYMVGNAYGSSYEGADAWKPALAAIVVPALFSWLAGGSVATGAITFIFPLFARWGGSDAETAPRESMRGSSAACA